jgi:5-methylcytosine-specific restriction enzyme A
MAVLRSTNMWLAAYFLSRCGQRRTGATPTPPSQLQASSWEEAYALFFPRLHGGRPFPVFHHSMKNARDMFDGHHDSGRVGWRENETARAPQPLVRRAQEIMDQWKSKTDEELWQAARQYADIRARGLSVSELEQLIPALPPVGRTE